MPPARGDSGSVARVVRGMALTLAPVGLCCVMLYGALARRLGNLDSALARERRLSQSLEERLFVVEQELRQRDTQSADAAEADARRRAHVEPDTTPAPKRPRVQPQSVSVSASAPGVGMLRQHFGLLSADEYAARRGSAGGRLVSRRFFAHLDDPSRFAALQDKEWLPDGTLKDKKRQRAPTWPRKQDKRYFEGYTYSLPFRCGGDPFECSGRGVCDYSRGVCVCMPPATGWDCRLTMLKPAEQGQASDFTQDDCIDQEIHAPAVEKWDARAEERCRGGDSSRNGMWLGMTQENSDVIARSIAGAVGIREGMTVMDVGMGCGTLSDYIQRSYPGAKLAGFDYSAAAVRYVRERHNGTFCVADVRELDFLPDNSVDVAFENGVFSVTREKHCETYRNVLRAVRPGGTFLIMQTYHDWHPVKCWQNIRMQSVEGCLGPLGVRMEYVLTRDLCDGKYDSYCAGETYAALIRKPRA
eukprot:TRINITY_DN748_c0_g3_i1.p1 TRINITY_DN748_c0_g3~~TRINITY_DN748_c0_g3_i1.p1  ORF type:complete len:472 (+),score=121.30 TRINITY_DN748_c0_g3_i1:58-1473(+)